ncbi:MAG TPA: amidase [Actinomycetota bacterium]|nr:amidase [Actinomycetota bacterium]
MTSLTEQAAAVAAGKISPVELVEQSLREIERTQPILNAFTFVRDAEAMAEAKEMDGAPPSGPLHGVPIAVKDLYDVAGLPTTGCCAAYLDRMASSDSPVVAKLRNAGAIVVGKTNMHELAFGATTQISCFGGARNPWDTTRIPAGSSGGSGVAVAAGIVGMAMGSDTGGSIRLPSAMCGVTGLKPTHGSVSLRGALPMTASYDTGGPLAVSADDCALVHQIIAGFDSQYVYSTSGQQLPATAERILLLRNWVDGASPDVAASVGEAASVLRRAGFTVDEATGPNPLNTRDIVAALLTGEFAHHFRDLWEDQRVSEPIRMLMNVGRQLTAPEYAAGREASLRMRLDLLALFEHADALLVPGAPYAAPRIDEVDNLTESARSTVFTLPVNAAGFPAVAFPIGFSEEGLPLGAQLIGPPWSELRLCFVASSYQRETDWHMRRPTVAP